MLARSLVRASTTFITRQALIASMSTMPTELTALRVSKPSPHVVEVELNRPKKLNAMNSAFWREIRQVFQALSRDSECRAVLITAAGKHFTSGLDLQDAAQDLFTASDDDAARQAYRLRETITAYQDSFTAIAECAKPTIVAIQGACIGGGVDLITATDVRWCTADSFFQVKEVDVGLAADVGTLQRLPKVVGNDSWVREICYTCRKVHADEALSRGLVSRVLDNQEHLYAEAMALAVRIAEKSPVAIAGTKHHLNYSREHTTQDALAYQANWNMAMLRTEDISACVAAAFDKDGPPPTFSKL